MLFTTLYSLKASTTIHLTLCHSLHVFQHLRDVIRLLITVFLVCISSPHFMSHHFIHLLLLVPPDFCTVTPPCLCHPSCSNSCLTFPSTCSHTCLPSTHLHLLPTCTTRHSQFTLHHSICLLLYTCLPSSHLHLLTIPLLLVTLSSRFTIPLLIPGCTCLPPSLTLHSVHRQLITAPPESACHPP